MTPVWWMAGSALLAWLAAAALGGSAVWPEALYGMLAPLVATCATWVVTARTYRANPERLTGVMVMGLAVKAVIFAVYVVVMLRGLGLRPRPFVASFTLFFVGLYGLEALFLKRLFSDRF